MTESSGGDDQLLNGTERNRENIEKEEEWIKKQKWREYTELTGSDFYGLKIFDLFGKKVWITQGGIFIETKHQGNRRFTRWP